MSCKDCEEAQESGAVAYYRWGKADIGLTGCKKHVKQVIDALNKLQEIGRLAEQEPEFPERMPLMSPCKMMVPDGVVNIACPVVDVKSMEPIGDIEMGTDGFLQGIIILNGSLYKLVKYPTDKIIRIIKFGASKEEEPSVDELMDYIKFKKEDKV